MSYADVEQMPPWERRAFLQLLVDQKRKEKEAQEQANGGNQSGDDFTSGRESLMRMPLPGETHGPPPSAKMRIAKFTPGKAPIKSTK